MACLAVSVAVAYDRGGKHFFFQLVRFSRDSYIAEQQERPGSAAGLRAENTTPAATFLVLYSRKQDIRAV